SLAGSARRWRRATASTVMRAPCTFRHGAVSHWLVRTCALAWHWLTIDETPDRSSSSACDTPIGGISRLRLTGEHCALPPWPCGRRWAANLRARIERPSAWLFSSRGYPAAGRPGREGRPPELGI